MELNTYFALQYIHSIYIIYLLVSNVNAEVIKSDAIKTHTVKTSRHEIGKRWRFCINIKQHILRNIKVQGLLWPNACVVHTAGN